MRVYPVFYPYQQPLKDYYIQNDRDHFIRDEKSKWVAPTPTPEQTIFPTYTPKKGSSSSKTNRTDPYEAHLYSDPDEYAFDYAEEFAEYRSSFFPPVRFVSASSCCEQNSEISEKCSIILEMAG